MRKLKRLFVATILNVCMLLIGLSTPIIVHAEDDSMVEPRMTYISSYTTDLSITSTGVATITGNVRGKSGVTSTYIKCTLQMSVGGGWVDVKSWEASNTSPGSTISETYQLSSRGTYRVDMVCRANTEEKTGTSAYRTY
ncbi:MAG: hypothetical protein IJD31_07840 [Lachnospiraceae bacterium]|nr:hypothetical protein [Lachnospiraceae bacterium]